ncbi:MAG: hypothetical protein ABF332_12615 [Akkermansiaceae bacterium]
MAVSSEITKALAELRRRIRWIQFTHGLLRLGFVFLVGLSLLIALDFIFAPLLFTVRQVLFATWLTALGWTGFHSLLRPLGRQIDDVKLARWLERRHPEIQERISTALELDGKDIGLSQSLLAELSAEAANDMSEIDPKLEVPTRRLRRSWIPLAFLVVVLAALLAVFPQEMSRLMARAFSPFSDAGNAGSSRFTFDPGDLEVLEGEEVRLRFTYEGSEEVRLHTISSNGGEIDEALQPVASDDDEKVFLYELPQAMTSFDYFLRAGRNESDHFKVKVYSRPTLENATVRYHFPDYTGWPDQVSGILNGVRALTGTEIEIKSRVPEGVETARFFIDGQLVATPTVRQSATGGDLAWSFTLKEGEKGEAKVVLDHQVKTDFELATFPLEAFPDEAPVVSLIEPSGTELRLNPEDQIIFLYQAVEEIGIASVEVELQVNKKQESPLKEVLPKRIKGNEWEGEAMVYLGSLVDRFPKAREFKLRLKVSDNRPAEFSGPGIGYSDWITVRLDKNAASLARQQLRSDQKEIKKAIQEVIEDTRRAEHKMHQVRHQLAKEELPESAQKKIAEARDQFAEAKAKLDELSQKMENSVQQHRTDELEAVGKKIAEAQRNAEFTPLQDVQEARESEADAAIENAREAIKGLEKLRDEINRDDRKVEDLAKLQELAQRQDSLAREAQKNADQPEVSSPEKSWQRQQEQVKNEVQQMVRQSPEAKAAALKAQAEKARELAEEAKSQADTQEQLAEVQQESPAEKIVEALKEEQGRIAEEAKQELSEAQRKNEERANSLPEAVSQAEDARDAESAEAAAESAKAAAEALAEGQQDSASQQNLQERQEQVAEAFEALAEGDAAKALAELENLQAGNAAGLAQELQQFDPTENNGNFNEARSKAQHAANRAEQAKREQANQQSQQAANFHKDSAKHFDEAAAKLEQAADQFEAQAEQASNQQQNEAMASKPGEPLAEALAQSSEAAKSPSSQQAAESAQAAAEALKNAAQEAKSAMSQNRPANQQGQEPQMAQSSPEGQPSDQQSEQPGDKPNETPPAEQGDPGVPPELARLGISAKDWQKIQATMKSDVSGSSGAVVPEDYRGLVKKYFEQVSGAKK